MISLRVSVVIAAVMIASVAPDEGALILFGPTPYLSAADSPFSLSSPGLLLEDFEDGALDTPGVSSTNGAPRGPSGLTDSVDGDDGSIDGSGNGGHS